MNLAAIPNPKGIPSSSPGLRAGRYPGSRSREGHNPNGVASCVARQSVATPLGLMGILHRIPKVARASQPWALRRNPVGILRDRQAALLAMMGDIAHLLFPTISLISTKWSVPDCRPCCGNAQYSLHEMENQFERILEMVGDSPQSRQHNPQTGWHDVGEKSQP